MTDEDTEIWQPGTVNLRKLTNGFYYLHSSTCTSPPCHSTDHFLHSPPIHDPLSHQRKHIRKQTHHLKHQHTSQLIKTALLNFDATCHFSKPSNNLPIIGPSHKTVAVAFGQLANTSASALLHTPARQTHILPVLSSNLLLSIGTFADNGYVTIFHEGNIDAMVHGHSNITITSTKPAILQGCRDKNRLWHIALTEPTSTLRHPVGHCINNVYDLPSAAHLVRYLHAALNFPTKNTLLAAICNGNLTTFPGLTSVNVMKKFPKSEETQKGHMKQIQQGL
ncbi:hypothetical protein ACHAW6_015927 [Cyclotella cf. meneghiniana]